MNRHYHILVAMLLGILSGCMNSPRLIDEAATYSAAGYYETAIPLYATLVIEAPNDPVLYYDLALAYAESGYLEDADALLQYALQMPTNSITALLWYAKGNVFAQQGRISEAIYAYQSALRIDPSNGDARYNLELMLLLQTFTPTPLPTDTSSMSEGETPTPTVINGEGGAAPTIHPREDLSVQEANELLSAVMQQPLILLPIPTTAADPSGTANDW